MLHHLVLLFGLVVIPALFLTPFGESEAGLSAGQYASLAQIGRQWLVTFEAESRVDG